MIRVTFFCWISDAYIFEVLLVTLCVFGIIGNSISFAVLHKYTSGNVGAYLLKALAVLDNIFLATRLGIILYIRIFGYYYYISDAFCILLNLTDLWTVCMIVIVAGNRYIAVCHPLVASRLCTINKVRLEILFMVGTVCIFSIPQNYYYCIFFNKPMYNLYILSMFVFHFVLILIIFFNIQLMRSLQLAQQGRMAITSRSSNDGNNITIVMIVIIIVFVVCRTPYTVYCSMLFTYNLHYCTYNFIEDVCVLLWALNSSVNFAIYCVFRRQFLNQLCMMFGRICGCPRQQDQDRQPNDA